MAPPIVTMHISSMIFCFSVISSNATNLERVSQFPSNQIPLQAAASTKDNVFWEGKIIYKRKAPKDRLPSCVSSSKFGKHILEKQQSKKKTWKSKYDWECVYCHGLFSEESNIGNNAKWINCDTCDRKIQMYCKFEC